MKKAHILRSNKEQQLPRNFFFVDTETNEHDLENCQSHTLKMGWGNYTQIRNEHGSITSEWQFFKDNNTFWDWVDTKIRTKQKYYLYAHNQHFDFFVLDGFKMLKKRGWEIQTWFINSNVFIISLRKNKAKLVILDSGNIRKCSLAKIGELYGLEKLDINFGTATDEELKTYCYRDVEILREWILNFREFVKEHELGNYRMTLASQAMQAFRHRFMKHNIYIHDNQQAYIHERNSYHGGRVECFRIGKFRDEDFYMVDVNSMYPYVMKNKSYPVKLISFRKTLHADKLKELINQYCVIADVTIDTNENTFVHRAEKTIFPIGEFRTTLTTEEIRYALKRKMVKELHVVSVYNKAKIFSPYISYFYNLKSKYKDEKNYPYFIITKGFQNMLYGKFGQYSEDVTQIDKCSPDTFETEIAIDGTTHEVFTTFSFGGKVFKLGNKRESFDSFPAIASHVTANARLYLYELMQLAGKDNVYYCDTDSLLVNAKGFSDLEHLLDPTKLGKLSLQGKAREIDIKGCKDYRFGEKVKIKGISKRAKQLGENTYQQTQFLKFRSLIRKNNAGSALTREITKTLKREYDKGLIDDYGKVFPFQVSPEMKPGLVPQSQ